MTKPLLLFVIALLAFGCDTAPRRSATIPDNVFHFTVTHSVPAAKAFNAIELDLAELYNDLPRVLKLRQVETGTLLLKPLVEYGTSFAPFYARYSMKIIVRESAIDIQIELGQNEPNGTWPAIAEMPHLKAKFRLIALHLAKSVNGTLSE
jgi:hypothetical protein